MTLDTTFIAALVAEGTGTVPDAVQGAELAAAAIDDGRASRLLDSITGQPAVHQA